MLTLEETLLPLVSFYSLVKVHWNASINCMYKKNHMKLKILLDLMWKASINSNWTNKAHLGLKEFAKVTTSITKLLWERSSFGSKAFNPILKFFIK
jgi:hypothetical protein